MARYKILDDQGRIANIIESEAEFAASIGAVLADDTDMIYVAPEAEKPVAATSLTAEQIALLQSLLASLPK